MFLTMATLVEEQVCAYMCRLHQLSVVLSIEFLAFCGS